MMQNRDNIITDQLPTSAVYVTRTARICCWALSCGAAAAERQPCGNQSISYPPGAQQQTHSSSVRRANWTDGLPTVTVTSPSSLPLAIPFLSWSAYYESSINKLLSGIAYQTCSAVFQWPWMTAKVIDTPVAVGKISTDTYHTHTQRCAAHWQQLSNFWEVSLNSEFKLFAVYCKIRIFHLFLCRSVQFATENWTIGRENCARLL